MRIRGGACNKCWRAHEDKHLLVEEWIELLHEIKRKWREKMLCQSAAVARLEQPAFFTVGGRPPSSLRGELKQELSKTKPRHPVLISLSAAGHLSLPFFLFPAAGTISTRRRNSPCTLRRYHLFKPSRPKLRLVPAFRLSSLTSLLIAVSSPCPAGEPPRVTLTWPAISGEALTVPIRALASL